MGLTTTRPGDAKYERVNVVVTAIKDALRELEDLHADDVILALSNLLGDAMGQKWGDDACLALDAVFNVVHGAIHNSLGKEPLVLEGATEEQVTLDRKHLH